MVHHFKNIDCLIYMVVLHNITSCYLKEEAEAVEAIDQHPPPCGPRQRRVLPWGHR